MYKSDKITKITESIYLGGYWCNQDSSSNQTSQTNVSNQNKLLKSLKDMGVTDIINCAKEIPFYLSLTDYNFNYIKYGWKEREDEDEDDKEIEGRRHTGGRRGGGDTITDCSIIETIVEAEAYLNMLTKNNVNNNITLKQAQKMDNLKDSNKYRHIVYIHCDTGNERSALLVIFHLMTRLKWSYETAYTYVKQRRDTVKINLILETQLRKCLQK